MFVYCNYHTVPIPAGKIDHLSKHITNELGREHKRFFLCCDVRVTPKEVLDAAELIPNGEVCHLNYATLESLLCDRVKCRTVLHVGRFQNGSKIMKKAEAKVFGKNFIGRLPPSLEKIPVPRPNGF